MVLCSGYSFIRKGKVGRGRRPLSFFSRHHASTISSYSRLGRGVFLFLCDQARSTNYCFLHEQRVVTGQDVDLMPLFIVLWACVLLLLHGLLLSKPDFFKSLSRSPTLCDPVDYTLHGLLQPRILKWVAFSISRDSSQPRDPTQVSHIAGGFFTS